MCVLCNITNVTIVWHTVNLVYNIPMVCCVWWFICIVGIFSMVLPLKKTLTSTNAETVCDVERLHVILLYTFYCLLFARCELFVL